MGQPDNIYQRIAATNWRHVWVVGDLHGCFSLLMVKLRQCHFDPWQDLLVSVGDVIDRGPDSLRCLRLMRKSWIVAVRGNHEQMALDALATGQQLSWFMNGGAWFAHADQPAARLALEACRKLPWILELRCRSGIHVVAHADYPDDDYQWQKEVDLQRVLWDRARLMNNGNGIRGADHFWFGHTPLRHRLDRDNLHYIDTGAVFGGELTLVQLQ
ncbi:MULTISPECIES: protein-serine/threonine phosphatase [Citrobacter]|uniref:protein-serine/threonine phosphatase n=1 Tax=Citrobacter TaxID=544 RepID=UPI0008465E13|nr:MULTISPECIES: protein-serine/threonine phosphatase [Citrobacter]MBQ4924120.1 protein-serine/threonine phosphatase [Citrobacter werkmanii]MBQ4936891.1 protein-serine/threonine phosphatase [Citrobacter werkmanii]MBQ4949756.1 protein-serine/threonine phosphatase [Citrobacter werkmanii]MBQ4965057.1 protein-serine/threonine phosphatase [Citrobacter werkmanii]MDM3296279.1 protein-serine/threonine phosphatase [Citrobacter sp. Cc139]